MSALPHPPFLLITDRRQAGSRSDEALLAQISGAIAGGVRWVSLREKDLRPGHRLTLLKRLKALAALTNTTLSVHDDIDAAEALELGLHLPEGGDPAVARARLGEAALIGVSAHDLAQGRMAALHGADYVTLSPVFESASKPGYGPALGLEGLQKAAAAIPCPVLALGGIALSNLDACLDAGAAGVAVMGEIMRAPDPMASAQALLRAGWYR
ncbi:MAG TPA: thiamine phosphate synthase [Stellaceae bacterium]|jgi:thiamine-phosphate pyrophosphorylase|nr:thiamine phosphate synthase [Stellaceae bacterium]